MVDLEEDVSASVALDEACLRFRFEGRFFPRFSGLGCSRAASCSMSALSFASSDANSLACEFFARMYDWYWLDLA